MAPWSAVYTSPRHLGLEFIRLSICPLAVFILASTSVLCCVVCRSFRGINTPTLPYISHPALSTRPSCTLYRGQSQLPTFSAGVWTLLCPFCPLTCHLASFGVLSNYLGITHRTLAIRVSGAAIFIYMDSLDVADYCYSAGTAV